MAYHRPPDLPLASFDPRYRELLIKGAQASFTLDCETVQDANALRARIHTYRSQAKKHFGQGHKEEWEYLYLTTIYLIKLEGGRAQLRFAPRQREFDHILSQMPSAAPEALDPQEAESLLEKLEREQQANNKDLA